MTTIFIYENEIISKKKDIKKQLNKKMVELTILMYYNWY